MKNKDILHDAMKNEVRFTCLNNLSMAVDLLTESQIDKIANRITDSNEFSTIMNKLIMEGIEEELSDKGTEKAEYTELFLELTMEQRNHLHDFLGNLGCTYQSFPIDKDTFNDAVGRDSEEEDSNSYRWQDRKVEEDTSKVETPKFYIQISELGKVLVRSCATHVTWIQIEPEVIPSNIYFSHNEQDLQNWVYENYESQLKALGIL